ncbi:fibronectin type III domain-containing protein [Seonamhaeicola aphaedonensis]|uniref:Fibronectin type-III domain-containing protein n=1 Tax=Seonamhaeicola aphaedonensis TaxID=1461338 RepID=A0A3D9H829_9FLAO|nr:hypothetical protein [Seonamhaeicola aphaedonensis]RED45644.1 hypothetical protein DFQ02_10822 [Seonamhaeicola aphaedonensis]
MKTINSIVILSLLGLILSCDDILEDEITDDNIQIVFPLEGNIIEGNVVQFSWRPIEGADNYRIQIIKRNQVLEVDSLITQNTFQYTLNPGTYQWRVRGENFAYQTAFTFPVVFSSVASDDLTDQSIVLLSPSEQIYTNNIINFFSWEKLANTTSYRFELIKKLAGEQTIFQETNITTENITVKHSLFDEDAEYIWKVKGLNESSETNYSQRSVFLDTEAPNQPSLTSPSDQDTLTSSVSFNWTNGTDPGNVNSAITNSIEISSDANFNTIVHSEDTTNNTVQYDFNTTGTFYWRVKAKDAANNQSDYSNAWSITVQ